MNKTGSRDRNDEVEAEMRELFQRVDLEHPIMKWLFDECVRRRQRQRRSHVL